jgi:hypothetical protein
LDLNERRIGKNWSSPRGAELAPTFPESLPSAKTAAMRTMEIKRFPDPKREITDLGSLVKDRLTRGLVLWPDQAASVVGYMIWPDDLLERNKWIESHRRNDEEAINAGVHGLKIVQQHWARVADMVHKHYDLVHGGHQKTRGGASVGKAISLISANAKSKGTGAAKLWEIWSRYRDVAHLAMAAVLVAGELQTRHRATPFRLRLAQFQPYQMVMLLPDLVIAVAMTVQDYGLVQVSHGRTEPLFNPETVWRIPSDINVAPLPLPERKVTVEDIAVLNARRAGNRGTRSQRKTTPVLA